MKPWPYYLTIQKDLRQETSFHLSIIFKKGIIKRLMSEGFGGDLFRELKSVLDT